MDYGLSTVDGVYDVAIIGGGVTGTGAARDCALRGLKTILLEKKDFSAGTTGACMGMIHGGMRYLEFDLETTYLSCIDSGYIQKIAPFLLFRIPLLTPVTKDFKYNIELVETFFEAYDKFVHFKKGKKHTRLSKEEALRLEPGLSADIVGAVTTDEWGIDPFRLCVLNVISAKEKGAEIRNHTEVISFLKDEKGNILGIKIKDTVSKKAEEIRAKLVLNAAGPWVPKICQLAGVEVKLRPSKGINIFFDRRLSNLALVSSAIDGRDILMMPHENTTMLGCTDTDFYGDLDNLMATQDEIEYLLQGIEKVFPEVRKARIIRVMAGVRPTLYEWGIIEDKLSREFEVYDHLRRDNVDGFITIAGGKFAMFRFMAEKATDLICKKLGKKIKCRTHLQPLPGAEAEVDIEGLSSMYQVPLYVVKRLVYRYGTRTEIILKMIKKEPHLRSFICICEPVTEAELRYVIREEWAKTLADLRRRTRLGTGPCQGMNCNYKAAAILGEELNLSIEETYQQVVEFLQERWKGKYPVLKGEQLVQEELNQALYFGLGGYEEIKRLKD